MICYAERRANRYAQLLRLRLIFWLGKLATAPLHVLQTT